MSEPISEESATTNTTPAMGDLLIADKSLFLCAVKSRRASVIEADKLTTRPILQLSLPGSKKNIYPCYWCTMQVTTSDIESQWQTADGVRKLCDSCVEFLRDIHGVSVIRMVSEAKTVAPTQTPLTLASLGLHQKSLGTPNPTERVRVLYAPRDRLRAREHSVDSLDSIDTHGDTSSLGSTGSRNRHRRPKLRRESKKRANSLMQPLREDGSGELQENVFGISLQGKSVEQLGVDNAEQMQQAVSARGPRASSYGHIVYEGNTIHQDDMSSDVDSLVSGHSNASSISLQSADLFHRQHGHRDRHLQPQEQFLSFSGGPPLSNRPQLQLHVPMQPTQNSGPTMSPQAMEFHPAYPASPHEQYMFSNQPYQQMQPYSEALGAGGLPAQFSSYAVPLYSAMRRQSSDGGSIASRQSKSSVRRKKKKLLKNSDVKIDKNDRSRITRFPVLAWCQSCEGAAMVVNILNTHQTESPEYKSALKMLSNPATLLQLARNQHAQRPLEAMLARVSVKQRLEMFTQVIQPAFLDLASHPYGSSFLQAVLSTAAASDATLVSKLIAQVQPVCEQMLKHSYAYLVLVRLVMVLPANKSRFLCNIYCSDKCIELCSQQSAVPVLEALFSTRIPAETGLLVRALCSNASELARDQHGSRVLVLILRTGSKQSINAVVNKLVDQIPTLAAHIFGNQVVIACIQASQYAYNTVFGTLFTKADMKTPVKQRTKRAGGNKKLALKASSVAVSSQEVKQLTTEPPGLQPSSSSHVVAVTKNSKISTLLYGPGKRVLQSLLEQASRAQLRRLEPVLRRHMVVLNEKNRQQWDALLKELLQIKNNNHSPLKQNMNAVYVINPHGQP